jgi:predicted permease
VAVISLLGALISTRLEKGGSAIKSVLLDVLLPALALDVLSAGHYELNERKIVALTALLVMAGSGVLAWLVARLSRVPFRPLVMSTVFMNAGALGVSFSSLAWGSEGLSWSVTFYIPTLIVTHTIGPWLAGSPGNLRLILRMPLPYATLVGVTIGAAGLELPLPVAKAAHLLGQGAVPLMLLMVGNGITLIPRAALSAGLLAATVRIGGGLLLGLLFVRLFDIRGIPMNVVLMGASMPTGATSLIFAQRGQANPEIVAGSVVISTIATMVVTPVLLRFLA